MFTTIEYDYSTNYEPWNTDGLAIPVVNEDDHRSLIVELRMDSTRINNGWVDTMPIHREPLDVFVDYDDPRNGNPPIVVTDK